jgi:hypothetical protein
MSPEAASDRATPDSGFALLLTAGNDRRRRRCGAAMCLRAHDAGVSVFAEIALILSTLGLLGLYSVAVARGARLIGVRIALGAAPIGVARMVIGSVGGLSTIALVVGLAASVRGPVGFEVCCTALDRRIRLRSHCVRRSC